MKVVAAAGGPVGSLVGQLAKIAGARAVGIAGGSKKCAYLKEELHFDVAVDHRSPDFHAVLTAACPHGIDVYFENVGGAVWQAVLPLLNRFARVPVSGLVAQYDGPEKTEAVDRAGHTDHAGLLRHSRVMHLNMLPSAFATASAPELYSFAAQWLACDLPYRRFALTLTGNSARLRADVVRYSFIVPDSHRLLLAGLPAHCEKSWTLPVALTTNAECTNVFPITISIAEMP